MQDPRGVDHVERARFQARLPQVGLHELHPGESEALRRRRAEQERGAGQIGADDHAVRAGEVQAHLPGAAANVHDPRISGDRLMHQAREHASLGPRVQRLQAVARRITRERRRLVKAAHGLGAGVAGKAQAGDPVRRLEASAAAATRPVQREGRSAARTGEQFPELAHPSKDGVNERRQGLDGRRQDQHQAKQAEKNSQRYEPPLAGVGSPHPPNEIGDRPAGAAEHDHPPPHAAAFPDHGTFSFLSSAGDDERLVTSVCPATSVSIPQRRKVE